MDGTEQLSKAAGQLLTKNSAKSETRSLFEPFGREKVPGFVHYFFRALFCNSPVYMLLLSVVFGSCLRNALQFFLLCACQMEKCKHHGYGLADEKAPPDAGNADGISKDIGKAKETAESAFSP